MDKVKQTWSLLKAGDTIPFVVITPSDVEALLAQRLKINKASIKSVEKDGLMFQVDVDPLGPMTLNATEFFTEEGAIAKNDDEVLIIAASTEYFTMLLRQFVKSLDIQ